MSCQTTVIKQSGGYCVVQREVAQAFRKHTQALGLYCFLLSLPDGWEFKKSWLKKETGIGINKLNRLLAFLAEHNLVKTVQRKVNGKFAEFEMEIFDGKDFKTKELLPLFDSPSHRFRATETVATEMEHKKVNTDTTYIQHNRATSPVDKSKRKAKASSVNLCGYPDDFYPDEKRRQMLSEHARRTNNTEHELLIKFETVSRKYKTRSQDWQQTFQEFIEREKPKKVYEDMTGKKRRYDNQSLYN